jgi:hypothetical protein
MYIYYQEGDGKIVFITSHKDVNNTEPCIEIDDAIGSTFLEGKQHPSQFFVDANKQLTSKLPQVAKQESLEHKIYAIPQGSVSDAELTIIQHASTKTLTVSSATTNPQKSITLVACKPDDPVWLLWYKEIDLQDHSISFSYAGTDHFRLYTRKTLKSYIHEKHS